MQSHRAGFESGLYHLFYLPMDGKMQKPKQRKCPHCKEYYMPFNTLQKSCMKYECMVTIGRKLADKERRKEHLERKKSIRNLKWYRKKAEIDCHLYIRTRDKDKGCISCDKCPEWNGQWHASHYRPAGVNSLHKFDEDNIHKACSECNCKKSGNLTMYRIRLIEKIGLEKVEYLENNNQIKKWTKEELIEIREHYKRKLKELTSL